ncbi:hypothetical protein ACWCYY_11280 [Kitasatospora sp. NPDC001664]
MRRAGERGVWLSARRRTRPTLRRRAYHRAVDARLGYRPRILRTVVHLAGQQPAIGHALRRLSKRLGDQAVPHLPPPARW